MSTAMLWTYNDKLDINASPRVIVSSGFGLVLSGLKNLN
jgi:hypothetical protein